MTKPRTIAAFLTALALLLTTRVGADDGGGCPGVSVFLHGTMQFVDVEGGCWQFVADGGTHYEPILGPPSMYCEGATGTLVGCTRPDLASTCQVGLIVEVSDFIEDTFTVHGTMHFVDVEGGCWQFVSDGGFPYEPIGGPPELYQDGACGALTGYTPCNVGSFCQVGQVVQVVEFDDGPGWADLGSSLTGTTEPALQGEGRLCADDPLTLTLTNTLPTTTAWLTVGFAVANAPFKGGTLVPDLTPPGFFVPLLTDGSGELIAGGSWPAGVPVGFATYFQYWVLDPGGPAGLSASNAVSGTTP